MNIEQIAALLDRTEGVNAWLLDHRVGEETSLIRLPNSYSVTDDRLRVETPRRAVLCQPNPHPREVISVLSESSRVRVFSEFTADGETWRGDAWGQLNGGNETDIKSAIDRLVISARSQRNRPFPLPGADEPYPETELADPELIKLDRVHLLERSQAFIDAIVTGTDRLEKVAISNIELFIRRLQVRFRNSAGAVLSYPATRVNAEICFLARIDENKVGEYTARLAARQLADLDPVTIADEHGNAALAIALAGRPPDYNGPVVLLGEAAADFLQLGKSPLGSHASSRSVFEKTSRYQAGRPVHNGPLRGEPLSISSDPLIPLGLASSRFNLTDGGASRSVTLVREGNWEGLFGSRRYHHYLGLPAEGRLPPGPVGNTVIPAGSVPLADLLDGPGNILLVRSFSSFEVEPSSGRFSCEIRLGERRNGGTGAPFKGGLLVGNWFDAIADANYAAETRVHDNYHGPSAVRLNRLRVAR